MLRGLFTTPSFRTAQACRSRNALLTTPRRFLNLHEYQSKQVMASKHIRVSHGYVAETTEEAKANAQRLIDEGSTKLIIKAQIHAGGRGKGHFDTGLKGGVQFPGASVEKIGEYAEGMLGNHLITKQTGPNGQIVNKVLVEDGLFFDEEIPEMYLAFLMDRKTAGPIMVASREGGMDIEEVARTKPEAILREYIDITQGLQISQSLRMAKALGFPTEELCTDAQQQMHNLYQMFIDLDCTQVEINPMAVAAGKVYCADAKLNFDENAEYRQKKIFKMRDTSMEDPREVAASKWDLNYIGLDGSIGCMVNGAGLAMATMDLISLHGASPANFLDVGGGATEAQVEQAFRILTEDDKVKAILVNIFGGIMRCDVIAAGIVQAARKIDIQVPLIVRLEGTNVEQGNEILSTSGVDIITAFDLDDAASKAVAAINGS